MYITSDDLSSSDKGSGSNSNKRKVSLTVVLLEKYQKNVPRKDVRKILQNEGKFKKSSDSPEKMKAKIS